MLPNVKTGIVILVIVIIGVAAFVFYRSSGSTSTSPGAVVTSGSSSILPHGSKLDFNKLNKYNADKKLFNYPQVSTDEVGVSLSEVLKPDTP